MLIVFISLDVDRNKYSQDGIPPKLFMGFGYNPNMTYFGERLDILSFFYWMKRIQNESSSNWIIYDASGYYIVNKTPQEKIRKLGNKPKAEQIIEALISEQDRPKRAEIKRNCELRSLYLQRAVAISGINARYVDSRKVFREDIEYRTALDNSLEFVERLQREKPELVARILPANTNTASRLYLPLEIAEALYFESKFGVAGKFGPKTEEFFDKAILELTERQGKPYQTIRCPFGPRKPGYLNDGNVIWTGFPDDLILNVLQSDGEYKGFVGQYLEPFRKNGEPIEEAALRMKRRLMLEEMI